MSTVVSPETKVPLTRTFWPASVSVTGRIGVIASSRVFRVSVVAGSGLPFSMLRSSCHLPRNANTAASTSASNSSAIHLGRRATAHIRISTPDRAVGPGVRGARRDLDRRRPGLGHRLRRVILPLFPASRLHQGELLRELAVAFGPTCGHGRVVVGDAGGGRRVGRVLEGRSRATAEPGAEPRA
ncbi:hypothetical protein P9139_01285 [Curtobacterium flaccumfaciens]|nr:hypothetical protein P9139_01285 [Curtobacterium flaccumfaciens]